jgi:general secretion pathway protein H
MQWQRRVRGFSLIELLVVVVIVGIVMSIAILSLSLVGGDQAVRQEAQRVLSLVEIAQDESMLQGREFGLEIMEGSYRFLELNPLTGQWDEILGDDTLRLRELPEEIELFLYIEDREVLLKRDPAQLGDEEDEERGVDSFVPHVLIYSSGDMTPFELHFVRRIDEVLIAIRADLTGAIEFVDVEETLR